MLKTPPPSQLSVKTILVPQVKFGGSIENIPKTLNSYKTTLVIRAKVKECIKLKTILKKTVIIVVLSHFKVLIGISEPDFFVCDILGVSLSSMMPNILFVFCLSCCPLLSSSVS